MAGLGDKVSGRVKKAVGDLAGKEGLVREGAQEERKGEAKDEREQAQAVAESKAREAEALERKTNPDALAESSTREELEERAAALGVEGRSDMSKQELAKEITKRQ
jgi:uncharacterized protein YjbJ (UPF0337 family)